MNTNSESSEKESTAYPLPDVSLKKMTDIKQYKPVGLGPCYLKLSAGHSEWENPKQPFISLQTNCVQQDEEKRDATVERMNGLYSYCIIEGQNKNQYVFIKSTVYEKDTLASSHGAFGFFVRRWNKSGGCSSPGMFKKDEIKFDVKLGGEIFFDHGVIKFWNAISSTYSMGGIFDHTAYDKIINNEYAKCESYSMLCRLKKDVETVHLPLEKFRTFAYNQTGPFMMEKLEQLEEELDSSVDISGLKISSAHIYEENTKEVSPCSVSDLPKFLS